jgi:hypothetical protein
LDQKGGKKSEKFINLQRCKLEVGSNWIRNIHKLVLELVFLGHKFPKRPNAIALSRMVTRSNVSHA